MNERLFELILAIKRRCQWNEDAICGRLGLSQAEFNALMVLDDEREILGGEFAERMGLSPSRGSRVLNRLVNDGLANVEFGSNDRRTIHVGLTTKGQRMRARVVGQMTACENRICGGLSQADLERLRKALKTLATVL
jgi:DNA-binding MarR family transcriptional regulator